MGDGIDFVILGLGMGCLMQMVSLIAQNSVELKDMGVATSARMFFQQMGGSLGVAAFGALFASRLNSVMSGGRRRGRRFHVTGASFDPAQVASLPPAVQEIVFRAVAHGVQDAVFLAGAAGVGRRLRARPVHQGSAAARPGAGRGSGARPRGGGAHRLAGDSGNDETGARRHACRRAPVRRVFRRRRRARPRGSPRVVERPLGSE